MALVERTGLRQLTRLIDHACERFGCAL